MTVSLPSPGAQLHGFAVKAVTPLPDLNLTLIELRHLRTGARYVHLAGEDRNNLFAVGFRTPPADSTGVAHILEHTVLCGSQRFPVRDPFFAMLKRSLNSFMNAMTASDWTFYPFATQNRSDFYNLFDIYCDAVFFPLLREEDFRQEGHRLEFSDPADPTTPLVRHGVVFNEMKGAMASPPSLLSRRLAGALYPTTTYHFNSGGEPTEIPRLDWAGLRAFHADYYHPSNAWFFSYGHLPLAEHLARLDDGILARFAAHPVDSAVPPEVRRDQPRTVVESYPLDPAEEGAAKSFVQIAWLTCDVADSFERLALTLLSSLLLGNPAAPLYQALLDSRLGENLAPGCGFHDDNRTTFFAAGLQGCREEDAAQVEALVLATLEEVCRNGFTAERIEGAIHRLEFEHREVSGNGYPYPLALLFRMIGPWLHNDDPVSPLQLADNLARLRRELAAGPFFSGLIRRWLLDNRHRVTFVLRPDPQLQQQQEAAAAAELTARAAALDAAARQELVAAAARLQAAQDAPPDLSVLPILSRADIPPRDEIIAPQTGPTGRGQIRWFDQPTNHIGYFIAHFPTRHLPTELRPLLPLYGSLLTQVGAAGYDYAAMAERMEAGTGGIQGGIEVLEAPGNALDCHGVFELRGKALLRKQNELFAILTDLATAPDFSDRERLRTVLGQIRVSLENSLINSGHSYAARSAAARLTPGGRLREEWAGLSLLRRVRALTEGDSAGLAHFARQLQELAAAVITGGAVAGAVTAAEREFAAIAPPLASFLAALPAGTGGATQPLPAASAPARRGWILATPVNFVTRVHRTVPFVHPDAAPLTLLAKLLRAGYLHREIREKGGAYGGMAGYDPEGGLFSLISYRDPQLARTLRVYDEAVAWAAAGSFGADELHEALLATFADLDRPLTPGGRGNREFSNLQQGLTPQLRQDYRERLLAVGHADVVRVAATYLAGPADERAVAVIASEEALLQANRELGSEGLELERI